MLTLLAKSRQFLLKDGGGQHKKGGLTLRGWYDMYHTQTCSEVEETWKDLRRLGYNGQLKRSGKS